MTKLVVRLQSSEFPETSFASQPKTMYRAGTGYCRIEEFPDLENGIHGLVIMNEPDTWMVNRLNKSAKHFVDEGPTFNCRMPVFVDQVRSVEDTKTKLMQLEFGRELAYFKRNGATESEGPVLQGKPTKAYSLEVEDCTLFLITTGTPERPVAIARDRAEPKNRETYWYGAFEQVPFDIKLFEKPQGVTIEDVKPEK